MALALLGKWEEAARDLHTASKIDYDEEISAMLKNMLKWCHFGLDNWMETNFASVWNFSLHLATKLDP